MQQLAYSCVIRARCICNTAIGLKIMCFFSINSCTSTRDSGIFITIELINNLPEIKMIFENNLTLSDGSKISTRNYNISSTERYVEFVGSKTGEHRVYLSSPVVREDWDRVAAHWDAYADAAKRAV
jgi:hypothetical protein